MMIYQSLISKLLTPPLKNSLNTRRHILLLIYYVVQQSRVYDIEELLDIWHGLIQGAVDSAIDAWSVCLRACVRALWTGLNATSICWSLEQTSQVITTGLLRPASRGGQPAQTRWWLEQS